MKMWTEVSELEIKHIMKILTKVKVGSLKGTKRNQTFGGFDKE